MVVVGALVVVVVGTAVVGAGGVALAAQEAASPRDAAAQLLQLSLPYTEPEKQQVQQQDCTAVSFVVVWYAVCVVV